MYSKDPLDQISTYYLSAQSLSNQSLGREKNAPRLPENFKWQIQCLGTNLKRLIMVVENAELAFSGSAFSASSRDNQPEIEALVQTCGDIGKTLGDCTLFFFRDELHSPSDRDKSAYAAISFLSRGYHLKDLYRRLAFHNIKIVTVVKAFERKAFIGLKRDTNTSDSRILDLMEHSKDIGENYEHTNLETNDGEFQASSTIPRLPEWLQEAFMAVTPLADFRKAGEELQNAITTFYGCCEKSSPGFETIIGKPPMQEEDFPSRTLEPTRFLYLNLMKCVWILQRIKWSSYYLVIPSDSLWKYYFREMEEICLTEYTRFSLEEPSRTRLVVPKRTEIESILREQSRIPVSRKAQSLASARKLIMQVSLQRTEFDSEDSLSLRREDARIILELCNKSVLTGIPVTQIYNMELSRIYIFPLYLTDTKFRPLSGFIFGGIGSEVRRPIVFSNEIDMRTFQHAITGYKVVYDQAGADMKYYLKKPIFSKTKEVGLGRIQIWMPRILQPESYSYDNHAADLQASVSIGSQPPSLTNTASTASTVPLATPEIVTIEKPKTPLLIFYSTPENGIGTHVSWYSVEIDSKTSINQNCCPKNSRVACDHSWLQRPGDLKVQQLHARDDMNLAEFGSYQNHQSSKHFQAAFIKLSLRDRNEFESCFTQSLQIYEVELEKYSRDLFDALDPSLRQPVKIERMGPDKLNDINISLESDQDFSPRTPESLPAFITLPMNVPYVRSPRNATFLRRLPRPIESESKASPVSSSVEDIPLSRYTFQQAPDYISQYKNKDAQLNTMENHRTQGQARLLQSTSKDKSKNDERRKSTVDAEVTNPGGLKDEQHSFKSNITFQQLNLVFDPVRVSQKMIIYILWNKEHQVRPPPEIWTTPKNRFRFLENYQASLSDKLKNVFENYSGEEWDWWPLNARKTDLTPGKVRIEWTCTCGDLQDKDVSPGLALRFQHVLAGTEIANWRSLMSHYYRQKQIHNSCQLLSSNSLGAASDLVWATTNLRSAAQQDSSEQPATSKPIANSPPSVTIPAPTLSKQQGSITNIASQKATSMPSIPRTRSNSPQPSALYILFCAFRGIQLQHSQLEIAKCRNDDIFFENLRLEYKRMRGFWRYWLDPRQFDHCEFVKFTRFYVGELARVGQDLPQSVLYQYQPRPPGPHDNPPITPHEFRVRFYRLRNTCGSKEALDRIPKRAKSFQVNLHIGGVEHMWGLQAVLRTSFVMVAIWQVLITAGGWAFMGWWLSRHSGDLQNAVIPVTVIITAIMVLWLPLNEKFKVA